MKMKMEDGYILVRSVDREEEAAIKTWKMMVFDKKKNCWRGRTSLQLLDKICRTAGGLIPDAKKEMERLAHIQEAVDRERIRPAEDLKPMAEYPVKPSLYAHQVRAANMALMVFGMVDPPKEAVK